MDWSGDDSPQSQRSNGTGAQRMGAMIFIEAANVVGESAVYDDQRGALLWVDIAALLHGGAWDGIRPLAS